MHRVSMGSLWLAVVSTVAVAAATAAGCGSSSEDSSFPNGQDGSAEGSEAGAFGDGGGQFGGGSDAKADGPNNAGPLVISPAAAVIVVTRDVNAGTSTFAPTEIDFAATYGGAPVTPTWSIDRGELGSLAASGVFDASGNLGGSATVTATYGTATAAVPVTIRIVAHENGGIGAVDGGIDDAGPGGYGGVGGRGPGLPVSGPVQAAFDADASVAPTPVDGIVYFPDAGADAGTYDAGTASDLELIYPYDKTVFPLGLLAPLVQWRSTHASQTVAVEITLSEQSFSFTGTYAYPAVGAPGYGDDDRSRHPIEQDVWRQATYSNGGATDPLHVAVRIQTSDGTVYGPVTETLTIAQGILTGTVYYNSYETTLNGGQGGVLAIHPGDTAPTLAVPSKKGQCHVCHSVAADGKTLYVQDYSYDYGSSYDLTDGGALIQSYHSSTSSDGTTNVGKFTFSGVYPDGTFGMACSGPNPNWHHYAGDSALFERSDGNKVASTGFSDVIKNAATPAFSPDGQKLAFSLWAAQTGADAGAPNGSISLDVMDFSCGADAGSVGCTTEGVFSNLRELYRTTAPNTYVAWPSFTPDAAALIFQHTLHPAPAGSVIYTHGDDNTGYPNGGAKAQLRYVDVPSSGAPTARLLCALNGLAPGCDTTQVSTIPLHPSFRKKPGGSSTLFEVYDDTMLNYEPTINPVSSGGYYWVVFTSRRRYGNVAAAYPYDGFDGQSPRPTWPITKKLWVAAIDATTGEPDPSHPAFYLPGQELAAGNMRGFWVVDPCKGLGSSCTSGEECCNGYCRPDGDAGGALVCMNKPTGGCSQELEACVTNADCCGAPEGYTCTNGRCAQPPPPQVPR